MRYVCWSPHGFTNFLSIVEKVMKVLYSEFVKPMGGQLKFTLHTSTLYFLSRFFDLVVVVKFNLQI